MCQNKQPNLLAQCFPYFSIKVSSFFLLLPPVLYLFRLLSEIVSPVGHVKKSKYERNDHPGENVNFLSTWGEFVEPGHEEVFAPFLLHVYFALVDVSKVGTCPHARRARHHLLLKYKLIRRGMRVNEGGRLLGELALEIRSGNAVF